MLKRTKTALVAGVSALALIGIGTGVAFATNAAPSPSGQGRGHHHHFSGHGHGLFSRVEHGEATMRTKNGTQVVDLQRGQVTAVNSTSMTVKSTDGFTATYAVNSDTKVGKTRQSASIGTVAGGDQVTVIAVKSGTTETARRVMDSGTATH